MSSAGGRGRSAAAKAPGGAKPQAAAAAAPQARSPFDRWLSSMRAVPRVPLFLGLTGAIPFIALAPPVSKHLFWLLPHDVIDNSAMFQARGTAARAARRPALSLSLVRATHQPARAASAQGDARMHVVGAPNSYPAAAKRPNPSPTPPSPSTVPPPRQVGYGISIVTFLGAVHWGHAMGSASMASPLMARAAREAYLWALLCCFVALCVGGGAQQTFRGVGLCGCVGFGCRVRGVLKRAMVVRGFEG
jgi:hypothetical protein